MTLAAATFAAVMAACGDGRSGAPDYSIVPPTSHMQPGASQQYSVTDNADVLWGLSESRGPAADAPTFPLEVSANGRYLVDQRGRPWRVQADAAWLMSSEATPEEVDQYLDTRQAQGFNSFYLMAMVHPGGYKAAGHAPNNRDGDPPFATPGDFSTAGATAASERYWAWIDSIIDKAAQRGMVVMLAYNYLGWGGGEMGWYADIVAQRNRQVLHDWGEWIGTRYRDRGNIIWFGLGDFAPPAGSEGSLRTVEIAQGIKDSGAPQPFMAEPNPPDEIPGEHPDFGPIVDMNSFYGYGPDGVGTVYETARRAWGLTPIKPAWMQEGTYEFENNWGHFSGESWDVRRGRYWSVLAGGTAGDGFGSKEVWQWQNIPESLDTRGAVESSYAFALFRSMPWWELRPSGTDFGAAGIELVPSGGGTWGELDYITAAITEHGDWLLAYVPNTEQGPRTFAVDLSMMAGPARARWFDPATGNYVAIGDGYANRGTKVFTTPGKRDDDTDDWVLVLDVGGPSPCGSITPAGVFTAPEAAPDGVRCEVTAAAVSDPNVIARSPVDASGDG
jgi:hypothetical protein